MQFYNTLTRKIETFKSNDDMKVKMYTCGPTVYHYAHIGNLRTYIMEDILEKTLNFIGYKVDRVMNITDVGHLSSDADTGEDKMVKGAIRENKTVLEIANYYTDAFMKDLEKLNIKKPDTIVKATSCIDSYIEMVKTLLDKNYAYISGGNVYFDTSKLKEYYSLTNHTKDDLMEAVRNDVTKDENKKNTNDFVLWFTKSKFQDQQLKWDSPWGVGYPGWHIECSCISIKHIHCGGVDNIFPHHTNEIAQSEAYLGHRWCNYWFHSEHLNDTTGKMSKSKGEFKTVSLLEQKGYNPLAYRLYCLQSHYRKQLLFTYENLDACQNTYNKLKSKINSLNDEGDIDYDNSKIYINNFKKELENDLNTASSITVLYDVLKSDLNDKTKLYLISEFDKVLSLDLIEKKEINEELKKYIENKIEERKNAKLNKNYELADSIRLELQNKGIILKDTREGVTYEIK